jgi:hypothetical protein
MIQKTAIVLLILFTMVSLSFAGPNMKEGKWEITMKMEMPGMPMEMPPFTHTQCLTKKDFIPNSSEKDQECSAVNVKTSGNTTSWSTKCKGQDGTVSGTGTITYKGKTFTGTMKVKQGGMEMTTRMNGKYLGKCDK